MQLKMRKQLGQICLFLALGWLTLNVSAAVQVEGLYEVEVPIVNQTRQERKRALRQGMADLITRLTGSQAMEEFGQLLNVLDRAPRYVEQYRYRTKDNPGAEPGQKPDRLLWVRFNRKSILKLLRDQQLPLWGSTRPETLVWIAAQDQEGRRVLAADQDNVFYRSVLTHARRRGVPILVPIMDLEDQRGVSIGDIWGGFSGSIKQASIRYATDNILIGRVFQVKRGWESRWTLITKSGEQHWSGSGREIDKAVAIGFDGLGDLMASRYALKSTHETSRYNLKIAAVNSLQDFAKAGQYLSNVSQITRFQPIYFKQGYATFAIELSGAVKDLQRVLKLEQRLLVEDEVIEIQPVIQPNPVPVVDAVIDPAAANQTAVVPAPDIKTFYYRLRP